MENGKGYPVRNVENSPQKCTTRTTINRFWLFICVNLVIVSCIGCSTTSVYVLDQAELVKVKAGETITAQYDGWLLSQRAVDRVMDAKIKGANLR